MKANSVLFCGAALLSLAACGGGGSGTGGGAGGGGGNGTLTISNASNASFNGNRSAQAPTDSTYNTFKTYTFVLDGGAGSQASFILDTSNNQLIDGDTRVKLVVGSVTIDGLCENLTCNNVSINTGTRTVTFNNQRYTAIGGGSDAFTVSGNLKY